MMRATELQARADALEIDVSDAGLSSEETSEHEAEICVLPIWQVPEFTLALAPEQEWDEGEEEDALLEPSDLLEVEAARTGAGLPALSELDELDELDEFDDEPVLLAEPPDEFDDNPIAITSEPASIPEPELELEFEPSLEPSEPTLADPIQAPLWRGLNTSVYVFIRGLRGMGQSPLVQLLAIGTMAVCMLLLGTTMLIFANASRVVHELGIDTPVTVYMQPDVDPATAAALRERIAALPEVARAERVSPEQALARLQAGAGETSERAELLAGIDPSVLPESVEIEFVSGVEPGFADALATRVQGMDGVEEVTVLGPWVQQVERMMTTVRALAIGVALLVSLACLAIVWSTIRLGVFARRSEIQLLRLVGGTARFVRGPFVVEGVVQGILGTALALTGLWLAFELIRPLLERGLALLFAAGSLQFFSNVEMIVALGFGALLGLIGSRAAVARHAEA
jgi:cell division protein FtsX